MAQRKQLLSVDYHYDSDTGLYEVGEIDFGISGEFDKYIKSYGRKGLNEIQLVLCHLIWHVKEYGSKIIKEQNNSGLSQTKTH